MATTNVKNLKIEAKECKYNMDYYFPIDATKGGAGKRMRLADKMGSFVIFTDDNGEKYSLNDTTKVYIRNPLHTQTVYVAVYGTLRKGMYFSHALEGCEMICKTRIPGWKLVDLDLYPAVIRADNHFAGVVVEVYEISPEILLRLDDIESYPALFSRKLVPINRNEEINAWLYYMEPFNLSTIKTQKTWVLHGDYKLYIDSNKTKTLHSSIDNSSIDVLLPPLSSKNAHEDVEKPKKNFKDKIEENLKIE